jgi:succinate-semialdehyde dehydrogenase / glutarate-semialdehyde dehydrogenase
MRPHEEWSKMGKYSVVNPATGETVKEYPQISDEDLSTAIAAAEDAHRNWGLNTSVSERASLVKRVAELHSERRDTLAEIIVREMGKPMEQALGEVD